MALKVQNPDYYRICAELRAKGVWSTRKAHIQNHPEMFGELIWRPVDRRENYVKRTIGLPGDRQDKG